MRSGTLRYLLASSLLICGVASSGCGGGTLGTGVPKFQSPREEERESTGSFWKLFSRSHDRCFFAYQQIQISPDGAAVDRLDVRGDECVVEISHLSRNLSLYVMARKRLAVTASVNVERESCDGDRSSEGRHSISSYGHDPRMGTVEIRSINWDRIRRLRLKFGDGSVVTIVKSNDDRCAESSSRVKRSTSILP